MLDKDAIREEGWGMKDDSLKNRLDLVPAEAIFEIWKVLTYWANKYEDNSWQKLENFESRYMWALLRHINAYQMWEEYDKESWMHHLSHALTNLAFLVRKENNIN